jgi:DNA-directed RNA polymerase subunit omega
VTTISDQGITNPPIDDLLERADSKYRLVLFAAKRAREINAYYQHLGDGLIENVGPMVESSPQEKPLSIALREINQDLLEYHQIDPNAPAIQSIIDPGVSFSDTFAGFEAQPDYLEINLEDPLLGAPSKEEVSIEDAILDAIGLGDPSPATTEE